MLVLIGEKAKSALLIAKIKFPKHPTCKVCLVPGLGLWFEKAAQIIDMVVVCTDIACISQTLIIDFTNIFAMFLIFTDRRLFPSLVLF